MPKFRPSGGDRTTCSFQAARLPLSKEPSSLRAATANNLRRPAWRTARNSIRQIRRMRPLSYLRARNVANPWFCAPPKTGRTQASSSGAAPPTLIAKEW